MKMIFDYIRALILTTIFTLIVGVSAGVLLGVPYGLGLLPHPSNYALWITAGVTATFGIRLFIHFRRLQSGRLTK